MTQKKSSQILLRHLMQHEIAVIPKSTNPERIKQNFDVFNFALSDEEMKAVSALARPDGRLVNPGWAPAWDKVA